MYAIRSYYALPFEPVPDNPVVYYQFNEVVTRGDRDGPGYVDHPTDKSQSTIDLKNIAGVVLKYIAYFSREEGLGGHAHDVEPAEFRIWVGNSVV